jgi:hypothetical protein
LGHKKEKAMDTVDNDLIATAATMVQAALNSSGILALNHPDKATELLTNLAQTMQVLRYGKDPRR